MSTKSFNGDLKATTAHILETGEFSDVVFTVGPQEEKIQAHKFMLMIRSAVFATEFYGKSSRNAMDLPDVDVEIFKAFLKYLYTDIFDATKTTVLDLLNLACRFDVPNLAARCCKLVENHFSIQSCVAIYQNARLSRQSKLEKMILDFMLENGEDLVKHPDFRQIDRDTLITLISNTNLRVDELTLFEAVLSWSKDECLCQEKKVTIGNQRKVLDGIIEHIRFPIMAPEIFSKYISGLELLTEFEENSIFRYLTNPVDPIEAKKSGLMFSTIPRLPPLRNLTIVMAAKETEPNRSGLLGQFKNFTEEFRFKPEQSSAIKGIGFYGLRRYDSSLMLVFHIKVNIHKEQEFIPNPHGIDHISANVTLNASERNYNNFEVMLPSALKLVKGEWYSAKIEFSASEFVYANTCASAFHDKGEAHIGKKTFTLEFDPSTRKFHVEGYNTASIGLTRLLSLVV